jgi:hypothetical protein
MTSYSNLFHKVPWQSPTMRAVARLLSRGNAAMLVTLVVLAAAPGSLGATPTSRQDVTPYLPHGRAVLTYYFSYPWGAFEVTRDGILAATDGRQKRVSRLQVREVARIQEIRERFDGLQDVTFGQRYRATESEIVSVRWRGQFHTVVGNHHGHAPLPRSARLAIDYLRHLWHVYRPRSEATRAATAR